MLGLPRSGRAKADGMKTRARATFSAPASEGWPLVIVMGQPSILVCEAWIGQAALKSGSFPQGGAGDRDPTDVK